MIERVRPSGHRAFHARWRTSTRGRYEERAFETEDDAKKFLVEIEARIRLGTYEAPRTVRETQAAAATVDPSMPSLVDYARTVLAERIMPIVAPGTGSLYRHNLDRLAEYFGERNVDGRKVPAKRLDEITWNTFKAYRVWRLTQPRVLVTDPEKKLPVVGPASVNREHSFLSNVLNHAVGDELLLKNPLAGMKKLKEPRKPRRWLSKSQAAAMIASADEYFRPFVATALFTACRPCELRGLTWGDVNFEDRKISIIRDKVGNADALAMHPFVEAELLKLRAMRPDAKMKDHVFLNRLGKPWRDFRYAWELTLEKAEIEKRPGLSPYSMRHTFSTHFLEGGGAITDLRAQLGHSDLSTTQIYADCIDERRKASVLALDYGPAPQTAVAKEDEAKGQPDSVKEPAAVYRVRCPVRRLAVAS